MTDDALGSQLSFRAAALRVVDLPLSVYSSLAQVTLTTGTKKLVAVATLGTVSLLFLAHHFQRRKGRRKTQSPQWEQAAFTFPAPGAPEKDCTNRQTLTLSLNSKSCYVGPPPSRGPYSKLSGSLQSLGSVKSISSSSSCTCANGSSCWDRHGDEDVCNVVNIPVTTPENLYLMGMELFEEALRRWEQALTFRGGGAGDHHDDQGDHHDDQEDSCTSVRLGAGDAIAEETVEDLLGGDFVQKLEALLQRAYSLQGDFERALGMADPGSLGNDKAQDMVSAREELDEACLRDSISIASNDSFVSAAELSEQREVRSCYPLATLSQAALYQEALTMAQEGSVSCRVLRTELLECLGDTDFLAKLHCVRQASQLILCERATRTFLADTGKKILSSIIVKARKSPGRFEEVFEEMISFMEETEHWENTEVELATRGVKHLTFYDVVLDFVLMDSFEDLENPPVSIQNVVNNRWLNASFKETAVASSCWSVLRQKRQHMKVSDGFIAHFYAVCEQISPVLAWGFLGPKTSLHDFCCFFKDQVLFFLRDIFDLETVRYSSVEALAEDMLRLLHRRCELLLAYLGTDALRHRNGCSATPLHLLPSALLEARV